MRAASQNATGVLEISCLFLLFVANLWLGWNFDGTR